MKNLLHRLTSRKFLLALGASITFYVNGQYTELCATVIAYLTAEGTADALERYKTPEVTTQKLKTTESLAGQGFIPEGYSPATEIVPGGVTQL